MIPDAEAIHRAEELAKLQVQKHPSTSALSLPPLFGVPFSVKDLIDVFGLETTLAYLSFAYTATATAPVVTKVLAAHGILIGTTNLDQFATGLTGVRSPYGAPRCVSDAEYISRRSSSGSVVSVAASQVSFAVCTDRD